MCVAEIFGMLGVFTFPALLPVFFDEWGLSNTEAGWINGIYFFGYAISSALLVSMTDRVDPKKVYLPCMLLTAVTALGFPLLASGFWSALALRFLAGIGLAGTYMPGLKALTDQIEGPAQSRAVSFYTSSFGIGSALSFLLSGIIARHFDWQTAFFWLGAGPVVALGIVLFMLPPHTPVPAPDSGGGMEKFTRTIKNRRAMGYTLAYMVHNFELFGLRTWVVTFLAFNLGTRNDVWFTPTEMAALITVLALPASVSGNEFALRFGRRRMVAVIMWSSALIAAFIGLAGLWPYWLLSLVCLMYGVTVMGDSSAITAGTVGESLPGMRGMTLAVHACVGFIGSFLGPTVFGLMLDLGGGRESLNAWWLAFATMGVTVALGPVFVLLLVREKPAPGPVPSPQNAD